eukprot:TRINITY_DN3374_c0_g1_i1.p1 TRINITY_DN3374_c0_g1~~TRINITY_DN3374_c0_g1_i1.p1  ORF type:complete len:196 (-),score=34.22 TRINITY_DN3374_c0_g1_i1:26-571(-)
MTFLSPPSSPSLKRKRGSASSQRYVEKRLRLARAQTLSDYISECLLDEDDPGLLLNWEDEQLSRFVTTVNSRRHAGHVPPPWLVRPATLSSLKQNFIDHLALVGGGSYGKVLVAPNSLLQYGNVCVRLSHIELDPFVQFCMQQLPQEGVIATTALVTDRSQARGIPTARVAPPLPHIKVFD